MSTRAQIKLKSDDMAFDSDTKNIYIYKHNDGYPSGVIPVLKEFVDIFHASRGCSDGAYLLCQIVRSFAVDDYREHLKKPEYGFNFDRGWGLDCNKHGDIAYLYEVDSKGQIFINGEMVTESNIKTFLKK